MADKLFIGKIPFMNLFPIFHVLERDCDFKNYEIIEGYPSALNRKLRHGEIDISPSSSIEYLRDETGYAFINGHSISSNGPIESIILFSRIPLESLDGRTIYATSRSETSVALLDVILRKFYNFSFTLKITNHPIKEALKSHSASLSIGDEALFAYKGYLEIDVRDDGHKFASIDKNSFFFYDLGELWQKHTGLPFVFALWTAKRKNMENKKALFDKFRSDLDYAKRNAVNNFDKIAASTDSVMPPEELASYWRKISYELDEEHLKGLKLFKEYLLEFDII